MSKEYYLVDKVSENIVFRVTPKENYPPFNKKVEIFNYKENKFIETKKLAGEIINPDYRQVSKEKAFSYIEKAKKK